MNEDGAAIVDVDGSYLYRKYRSLADAGKNVSLPTTPPPPPISGWITMSSENYQTLSSSIPPVTHGKFYIGVASWEIQCYLCISVPSHALLHSTVKPHIQTRVLVPL